MGVNSNKYINFVDLDVYKLAVEYGDKLVGNLYWT